MTVYQLEIGILETKMINYSCMFIRDIIYGCTVERKSFFNFYSDPSKKGSLSECPTGERKEIQCSYLTWLLAICSSYIMQSFIKFHRLFQDFRWSDRPTSTEKTFPLHCKEQITQSNDSYRNIIVWLKSNRRLNSCCVYIAGFLFLRLLRSVSSFKLLFGEFKLFFPIELFKLFKLADIWLRSEILIKVCCCRRIQAFHALWVP